MLDLPTPDAPMTTSLTVRIARKLRRAHEQYGRRYVVVVEMREDESPVMEYFSRVLAASRRLRLFLPNHDDHLQPRAPTSAVDLGFSQAAMAEVANVPCSQRALSSSGRGASDVRIDIPQRSFNGYRWFWQRSCAAYARLLARVGIIVPINRLPFELLVRIFEFTVVPDRHRMEYLMEHSGGYTYCIPFVDLICVTHVCRLWRDVSLVFTTLYRYLSMILWKTLCSSARELWTPWVEASLQRARRYQ